MFKKPISYKAEQFTESVIRDMTRLALKHGAINLSQGFPDFSAPEVLKKAASDAVYADVNQYAITWGAKNFRDALVEKMKRFMNVEIDPEREITVACGSTEAMLDVMMAVINPGDEVIVFEPFYENYGPDAIISGATPRFVQLHRPDWTFDETELEAAFNNNTKMLIMNTPNNPTGNLASESQVRELLDTGRIVVVDEAYFEFCKKTAAGLIPEHENLVVLRTMSKWAGLAGLRIGYGIMSPSVVSHIIDIKSPYNVNIAAEAALLASLEDAPALLHNVDLIVQERERMFSLLKDIPGVNPWPSAGNFVLCQFAPGRAGEIFEELAGRGIFLRNFGSERLRDCFRIAAGTPEQTDAVIAALKEIV